MSKLKERCWRGTFTGLFTGLIVSVLILISGDDSIKLVAASIFILGVGLGLSIGLFIDFLRTAGTSFIAGSKAALIGGSFMGLVVLVFCSFEKEMTFLIAAYGALTVSLLMIFSYGLSVIVIIGIRRILKGQKGGKNE